MEILNGLWGNLTQKSNKLKVEPDCVRLSRVHCNSIRIYHPIYDLCSMHTPTILQFQTGKEAELNREPGRVSNQLSDAVGEGGSPSLTKRTAGKVPPNARSFTREN